MIDPEPIFQFVKAECQRLGIDDKLYVVGSDPIAGFGEIMFGFMHGKWTVSTEERGSRFDLCVFENVMDAIRFYILKLTVAHDGGAFPRIKFNTMPDGYVGGFD